MSQPSVEPYLFYGGRCEEALNFYASVVGAVILFKMRYNEAPDGPPPGMLAAGFETKLMHANFRIGSSMIMASDGCNEGDGGFHGISLTYNCADEAEAHRVHKALSADGGKVTMPLAKTFWSPCFGMVEDKFGLGWLIIVPGEAPQG